MTTPLAVTETEEKLRVAIYIRFAPNRKSSYSTQKAYLCDEVKKHTNWELIDMYVDNAYSTKSVKKRPEFTRMMRDCENGRIDLILMESTATLSTSLEDVMFVTLLFRFRFDKTRVFLVNEHQFL